MKSQGVVSGRQSKYVRKGQPGTHWGLKKMSINKIITLVNKTTRMLFEKKVKSKISNYEQTKDTTTLILPPPLNR